MNSTLDKSLDGISFIEKIDNNELEESITKCLKDLSSDPKTPKSNDLNENKKGVIVKKEGVANFSLNTSKNGLKIIKPILKSSKKKIDEMKAKIVNIFKDNDKMMDCLNEIQIKNDNEIKIAYSTSKRLYEKQLESIYEERTEMINSLNDKYNYDIFRLRELLQLKVENNNSTIRVIHDELVKDKQKEKEKIGKEFIKKKNQIKIGYKESTCVLTDFTIDDRSFIYKNELFEQIKERINEIVSPEKKRVSILTEVKYINS